MKDDDSGFIDKGRAEQALNLALHHCCVTPDFQQTCEGRMAAHYYRVAKMCFFDRLYVTATKQALYSLYSSVGTKHADYVTVLNMLLEESQVLIEERLKP